MMALSRELREQKAYQLLYLQHLELEALVNKKLPSTSVPDSTAKMAGHFARFQHTQE